MPRVQTEEETRIGRRKFLLGTGAAAVLVGASPVSAMAATSPTTSEDWDQVPKLGNVKNFVLNNVWINGERFDGAQADTG